MNIPGLLGPVGQAHCAGKKFVETLERGLAAGH